MMITRALRNSGQFVQTGLEMAFHSPSHDETFHR